MKWIEAKVVFEADDIEEIKNGISAIFYEFGVQGVQVEEPTERNPLDYYSDEKLFFTDEYSVTGYFPLNPYVEAKKRVFKERVEEYAEINDAITEIYYNEVDDCSWKDNWKNYFYPEKISSRIVVKPTWREYEKSENEIVIEIDPGMAFGTGAHPTTSLCVSMLESYVKPGDSVLDVGTGSGILMIAAKKLGADYVEGIDIDQDAVDVAIRNMELNGIKKEEFCAYKGNLIDKVEEKQFNIVVSNILAEIIVILLKDIKRVVKDGGKVIFSGIIAPKKKEVEAEMKKQGFTIERVEEKNEWVSIVGRS